MNKPWYFPSQPDEIVAIPWLHPRAIEYLEGLLKPNFRVLEHGAGGSTLWFASRVREVVSIEQNPTWIEKVREMAPSNVSVLQDADPDRWGEDPFDLLLIDGERYMRSTFLLWAPKIVKPGGYVVLDNANRPEYALERREFAAHAKKMMRFDNNMHFSKYFVTEFWQCVQE